MPRPSRSLYDTPTWPRPPNAPDSGLPPTFPRLRDFGTGSFFHISPFLLVPLMPPHVLLMIYPFYNLYTLLYSLSIIFHILTFSLTHGKP